MTRLGVSSIASPQVIANMLAKARSGTSVVLLTVIAANVIRLVSTTILTRLLSADAFGVVGIIASISVVLAMLSDIGVYPFVVRHKEADDPVFLDQIWTARLIRSILLTVLMIVLAGPLASFSGKPELHAAIAVWAFTFLLEGLSSMSFATAVREQKLIRLSVLELLASILQVVFSIAIAIFMRSYWSIIYAMLLSSAVKVVLSYTMFDVSARKIRFSASRSKELWLFSRFIAGSSILGLLISQFDKIVFAKMMSLHMFGMYAIATSLAVAPMAFCSSYVHKVLYPKLAEVFNRDPAQLRSSYYELPGKIAYIYPFLVGGLIGVAPTLIAVLYDDRYQGVASIMQILTLATMLGVMTWSSDQVLVVIGQSFITMMSNVARVIWLTFGAVLAWVVAKPFLLIVAVGTVEIPALILFWVMRGRQHLIDYRREFLPLLAGGAGVLVGAAVNAAAQYMAVALGIIR